MAHEGLVDKRAIAQCLGMIISEPAVLDDYKFEKENFAEPFYMLIYSAAYNLYVSGVNILDPYSIDSFLKQFTEQYKIFVANNGLNYICDIVDLCEPKNFPYYYERLQKFSLLRYWEEQGLDTRQIYDSTVVNPSAQEEEVLKLDRMSLDDMIDIIDNSIVNEAKIKFSAQTGHDGQLAGKGMMALKESFKEIPDYGLPLQSPILSTISRGARSGKLFLRSGSSGSGKTRLGLADIVEMSVPYFYNTKKNEWEYTGFSEPGLMITTELEIPEIQTIMVAHVSGVQEWHIRDGEYLPGEEDRVDRAIEYIEQSPLHIEYIPDFGIKDITNIIKKYKREYDVRYLFFDYIHMSNHLIMEVAQMSKGMKLREDQILFLFVDALKNLCNQMDIWILSSTQLNGTYKDSQEKDETMLRGAKALADRIDLGEISLPPSAAELKMIEPIMRKKIAMPEPNLIRHIYKLRAGKFSKIKIFQHVDMGTARTEDLFALDRYNNLIDIPIIDLQSVNKENNKAVENIVANSSVDIHQMPEDLVLDGEQAFDPETGEIFKKKPVATSEKSNKPKRILF